MGEVVDFDGFTKHDIDPDKVLEGNKGEFSRVLVIGWSKETDELVVASSFTDGAGIMWLLERAKHRLHQMVDEDGR